MNKLTTAQPIPKIWINSKPEALKELLFKHGQAILEMNTIENDYTRSCRIGERLIVEPGSPKINERNRYVVGIGDKLLLCRVLQEKQHKEKLNLLGYGEVDINEVVIWCQVKKRASIRSK